MIMKMETGYVLISWSKPFSEYPNPTLGSPGNQWNLLKRSVS